MDGKKVYQIQINGIQQSIDAVEALNKQLNALEQRIKTLESSNVKINTSSSVSKSSTSTLTEEVALEKELNKLKEEGTRLDAKIAAAQDEVFQKVDATKQLYKETLADQKALAAQERLTANAYSNTMQGMKQNLADLKAVINTTDLGDSDKIQKMTKDAGTLTEKLKKMEEAYGQFGRNVGNYANGVAQGMQQVIVTVGGVERTFANAREASRTLGNELKTLAINGKQGTKEFKELQKAVAKLSSDIKDATVSSKGMDNLLDTMQSFVALSSVSKGISALFGVDDDEIQKSIQKLVALQNVMQGIEKINQQINSQEGIGGWLAKGNSMIDAFTAKLTGASKAQEALNKSMTAGKTASEGLAAAETAQATATGGATLATKALGVALKGLGIGIIISLVAALIDNWEDLWNWLTDTIPALKNLSTWFGKVEQVVVGVGTAILNFLLQPLATLIKTVQAIIDGKSFGEIANIISDGFKKGFDFAGNYQKGKNKEIERQQWAHNKEIAKANEEWLKDEEAKYGKSHQRTQEYLKKQMTLYKKDSKEYKELQRQLWEDERQEREENQKKALANSKKYAQEEAEVAKTINDLELKLMKEGLNKKLRQLDEEERQTLNKLKNNSRITADELRRIQQMYYQLRVKEMEEYLRAVEEKIKTSADNIKKIEFDLNIGEVENKIQALKNQMEELTTEDMSENSFGSLKSARDLNYNTILVESEWVLTNSFHNRYELTKQLYGDLIDELITFSQDEKALNEERIREQEKQQREAESERYSIQMSGLTQTRKEVKDGLKAIEDEYKVSGLEEIETIKDTNKEIYEKYHDLFAKGVENDAQIETAKKQHKEKMQQITEASNNAIKKNELDTQKEISSIQEKYYNLQISNFRDFQSKINTEMQRQPVTDLIGFGIVNLSKSKKNYKEIKNAAINALKEIEEVKAKVDDDLDEGLITDEAAEATYKSLEDMEQSFKQTKEVASNELKDLTGKFIASIGQYIDAVGQTMQGIMSAVWDFQDYQFDRQQEELDKWNEELDKALDEQENIISEHNEKINSIEDELSTARGDRRQHLIDQLNAEIAAQREAEKEKQRIEKEQEKAQKRQDDLDKKRKKAEYDRNLQSILVSGAMAVTNAFATQPFVPVGLAMGALATTLTAVQYALAKQQKPYANGGQLDGGVAQGARHKDGGIPVLGGRASIEGGEFITNRQTTAKNVDLLEYINAKHRKLNIDDFIDFYSSGNAKKNFLASSPRQKFADGGIIPTLNNEYTFDDRLLTAFEDYSNREVVVSVVDINNRQAAVKNVQVLAGLTEE